MHLYLLVVDRDTHEKLPCRLEFVTGSTSRPRETRRIESDGTCNCELPDIETEIIIDAGPRWESRSLLVLPQVATTCEIRLAPIADAESQPP